MKNRILLLVFLVIGFNLICQVKLPPGVESLGNNGVGISFMLMDKNNVLWEGAGGIVSGDFRANKGLNQFKNNTWTSVYNTGIFTDAVESGDSIYFSAYDGIYAYDGNNFSINYTSMLNTSIDKYMGQLVIGSFGNGLIIKSASGYKKLPISINGKSYDSIYCVAASGNELLIGTTDGLIVYDGSTFRKYDLPTIKKGDKNIIKNQKAVISVQKDADGKIWVLNKNVVDSLECLYILDNGSFISALEYYGKQCIQKYLLPYNANKLALNANGNITIGMSWGILEMDKDSIHCRIIVLPYGGFFPTKKSAGNSIAYCDRKNKIYYCNINPSGIVKLKPDTYSMNQFYQDPYLTRSIIDINDIKSTVTNTGINFDYINFYNPTLNLPSFKIPNIGCASAMFSAAIWMGGTEAGSGDLHLAAETYRQTGVDFKPGPIDMVTRTYDSAANSFYNRIWKINRETIDNFKANKNQPFYIIPKEIMEWPAHGTGNFSRNLAPFVDTDNNGLYEPLKGDYPMIKGDQMLWWVFNDLGKHSETQGKELGVEVHGSCYAYYYRDLPVTDTNSIVNRTLIFNYKIINRSDNNYKEFNTGIWNDVDLGNYTDDYVGCDVEQNAGFGYNGDNNDEGPFGFGNNPPMIFCKFLNKKMSSFIYYNNNNDPVNGNPNQDIDYYNFLNAKWQNGNDLTFGGNGVGGSIKTKYMFDESTNPNTTFYPCWSERTAGNSPGDRRFLMSSNKGTFSKDSIIDLEFAYILYHDPSKDFSTMVCNKPKDALKRVQNWYDKKSFPSRPYYGVSVTPPETVKHDFLFYPNPANSILNLRSELTNDEVINLQIFDSNGKLIFQILPDKTSEPFNITIDISSFATGIYLVKANSVKGTITGKVVVER